MLTVRHLLLTFALTAFITGLVALASACSPRGPHALPQLLFEYSYDHKTYDYSGLLAAGELIDT
ncbi:MAG: hypothetical protein ACRDIB_18130, partial [Ardenticatenaceae bacterium]